MSAEEDHIQQEIRRRQLVGYAKHQLYEFYGSAAPFFPGARADLTNLKNLDDNAILRLAQENDLL